MLGCCSRVYLLVAFSPNMQRRVIRRRDMPSRGSLMGRIVMSKCRAFAAMLLWVLLFGCDNGDDKGKTFIRSGPDGTVIFRADPPGCDDDVRTGTIIDEDGDEWKVKIEKKYAWIPGMAATALVLTFVVFVVRQEPFVP